MSVSTPTIDAERDALILAHLPQVRLHAIRIHARCPRQVEVDDLVAAGTIGLIRAVDRFDPARECLLKTLAEHHIRGAILDYLRRLDPLPRTTRRFAKQCAEARTYLEEDLGRMPDEFELAAALSITVERYRSLDRVVRASRVRSIDDPSVSRTL